MRYPPLLIALFLTMLLKPFVERLMSFDVIDSVSLLAVFLTVIYAFRHRRRLAVCLTLLAMASVTLRLAADYWRLPIPEIMSHGFNFIAMVLVMIAIFSEVLRASSASSDLVVGAVCLYFVIGLAWTFLYYSIYLLSPASIFVSPGTIDVAAAESKFTEVFYFSSFSLRVRRANGACLVRYWQPAGGFREGEGGRQPRPLPCAAHLNLHDCSHVSGNGGDQSCNGGGGASSFVLPSASFGLSHDAIARLSR